MTETTCFHCGLPVPAGAKFSATIGGQSRAMCCPGCQAVASAIAAGGLDRFYRYRSELSQRPDPERQSAFAAYDLPEVADPLIEKLPNGHRRVRLLVGGINCAACSWLIENYFSTVSFVDSVSVNVSAHRAEVEWDPAAGKLSELLQSFLEIGYDALPLGDESAQIVRQRENRSALMRLGVAGIGMMQAGMLAVSLYAGALQGIEPAMESFLRWVSLIIATPVVFYSGNPFFRAAWRNIRVFGLAVRQLTMDVPVSIALLLAWSASAWATVSRSGEVYFDSVSMFVFFLLVGRYLEMRVRHRNEQLGEGVAQLLPPVAVRIGDSGDESVPVASLRPGDHIRVAAGETFGCDGRVITGESAVNESLLTGEAEPVRKQPGSQVCAGSVNGNAPLVIAVEALGQSTRLSSILTLVDRAQSEKPPQRAAADRIAGIFVAAVLVIAGGVALAWWAIEPARALWVTISVLVVTCPCALSLATPAALAVASGELRRSGFLVTRGHVIEALAEADTVVFDKTGTLTEGRKKVEAVVALSDLSKSRVLAICRSLERGSAHPIAEAFDDAGQAGNAENVEHHLAEGVSGWVDGQFFALGKPAYVERLCGLADMRSGFEPRAGQTEILLASRGQAVAWIQLNDSVRRGVAHTIEMLTARGLNVELLSGDKVEAVSAMADSVGIDIYRGEVTPEQKLAHIRQLQNRGHRVVMVGDGINDVPVLSGADVSVAIGEATDLTRIHADSILLSSDFAALIKALDLAGRTRRIIRQNLGWALIYNLLALPLAIAGLIPPWLAAIGMSLSSLLVVVNALRIRRQRSENVPPPIDVAQVAAG